MTRLTSKLRWGGTKIIYKPSSDRFEKVENFEKYIKRLLKENMPDGETIVLSFDPMDVLKWKNSTLDMKKMFPGYNTGCIMRSDAAFYKKNEQRCLVPEEDFDVNVVISSSTKKYHIHCQPLPF